MEYSDLKIVQELLKLRPMDNDLDKLEVARLLHIISLTLNELPPNNEIRQGTMKAGYRYLRITVTDMDTGQELPPIYTMRQSDTLSDFHVGMLSLARWPKELLDRLNTRSQNNDGTLGREQSLRLVINRQTRGGRPKQEGPSSKKQAEYRQLADWYHKTAAIEPKLTEREFCRRANVKRSKLTRALRYASKNAP